MNPQKSLRLAALAAAGALTLTACGGDDPTAHDPMGSSGRHSSPTARGSDSSDSFDKADVAFASRMVPHHQQAVQMARMARSHADSPGVKRLAARIEAAQGPQIRTMTGWLHQWGVHGSVPPKGTGGMDGMDGGGGGMDDGNGVGPDGMPAMMASGAMDRLDKAGGAAFDRLFLMMMIEHHRSAITMARTEQAKGRNADAVALARKIETTQTAEIAEMRKMLGS